MKKITSILFLFLMLASGLFAQPAYLSPFKVNVNKTNSISKEIKSAVNDAKIIDVDLNIVKQVVEKKSESISVEVPNGISTIRLVLNRFEILAPGAKIVAGTVSGDKPVDMNNTFIVYTSNLKDKNSPLVVMTFFRNDVTAMIISSEDVAVLSRKEVTDVNSDYIFFQQSKTKANSDFKCGAESLEIPKEILEMQKNLKPGNVDNLTSQIIKTQIAVESDYETFQRYGSVENASKYILSLLAPVSAIYTRDINVQIVSTYLRVWDNINDPYNGTTSNTLLNEFRSYWNSNMTAVPRNLAHYITTRPGGLGGIAWVNQLCANVNNGYGYAFSDIDGTFNSLPAYSWDVMVVSHETGHNFGSPHTHSCTWPGGPIDSCYATEGACYTGAPIAIVGTIMSYCHLNGSISLVKGFGPLPTQLIRNNAENAPCLTPMSGFLVATPNGGEIFRSGQLITIIWGTSITGNVNIEYSSNNGTNWSTIQNGVSAILRNVDWTLPYMPTVTQGRVRVYETGNTSNGDLSDSSFQIRPNLNTFSVIDPPQLYRMNVYAGDTTKVHFTFTSAGTLPEIKYKWVLSTINNSNLFNRFSNNNGNDTMLSISKGTLDSIVTSWGAANVGDSLRLRWNVKSFTQLDSLQTNNSFLITFVRSIIGIQTISQVIPNVYFVNPNYPNPFNPTTNIKFGLPKATFVKLTVFDILGREVSVLVNEKLDAGEFSAGWNAAAFPSGVYFYRIEAGEFVKTAKMILVK
ncbi:MAG: zinc-dependent metalloprotease [Ignavibacteria bacterium]|nr:zinc-dependent metalloprotease [Ignavibacteria bacterium]